ncbi:MAG: hypothetical protein COA38_21770 [Fluviicola sp.]|nr:MAG: hypothetical protein COA38_21770 [Fluviicola sp.]
MANADGSINVRLKKNLADVLQKATLMIMIESQQKIKESQVLEHLLENYLEDSKKDLINKRK